MTLSQGEPSAAALRGPAAVVYSGSGRQVAYHQLVAARHVTGRHPRPRPDRHPGAGAGGTSILAEMSQVLGAERLLTAGAVSAAARRRRLDGGKDYEQVDRGTWTTTRPHGNRVGGLATVLEKSLGAVAQAELAAYDRAGPGVDGHPRVQPFSVTGIIAGGITWSARRPGVDECSGASCRRSGSRAVWRSLGDDPGHGHQLWLDRGLHCRVHADGRRGLWGHHGCPV